MRPTGLNDMAIRFAVLCCLALPSIEGYAAQQAGDRLALTCPDKASESSHARPSKVYPSEEAPIRVEFSQGPETVSLSGAQTESDIGLGSGDDTLYLYHVGQGAAITAGSGADTILVCSMDDLSLTLSLGEATLQRDSDPDVVIIEPSVFVTVPARMRRSIQIFDFDAETDVLVIRAPADLLAKRQASANIGGIRIGDVLVSPLAPAGAKPLRYDSKAFVFQPVR